MQFLLGVYYRCYRSRLWVDGIGGVNIYRIVSCVLLLGCGVDLFDDYDENGGGKSYGDRYVEGTWL